MNYAAGRYNNSISQFALIGINFNKADAQTRSRFAITKTTEARVFELVKELNILDFFLLSTCNRTEFYGCAPVNLLKHLVSEQLQVSESDFNRYFYTLTGIDAVRHFFYVVSGLDSQIIGDYEIVSQVKASLEEARKHHLVGTIADRISNFAYQAQKKVKAHTNLSSGKYSVSYAAADLIFHESQQAPFKNILLVGVGDFGASVARSLRHYFNAIPMAITNRTLDKAEKLAKEVNAEVIRFDNYKERLGEFDVVITSVGSGQYLIQPEDVRNPDNKLFLDLSVPQAIHPDVKRVKGVRLFSVDEVSTFHNELLHQRKLEIPRAKKIIDHYVGRLIEWQHVYSHRQVVLTYKQKIQNLLSECPADSSSTISRKNLDRAFSVLIQEIREEGYAGCRMIETMNSLVLAEK